MLPCRVRLAVVAAGSLALLPRPASAGNASYIGVAAVTPDGSHYAVFQDSDGFYGSCGLTTVAPKPSYAPPGPLIVTAACVDDQHHLLPFERWKWARRSPRLAPLRPFRRDQAPGAPVQITRDKSTRLQRLELLQNGSWVPILADDSGGLTEVPLELRYGSPEITDTSTWAGITGFVRLDAGSLVRLWRTEQLLDWDEVLVVTDSEVSEVAARFEHERLLAADATARLRAEHAARAGVFIATPAGPLNQRARKRNRAAAAREAVRSWERAAAFVPLGADEVRDALWLLAFIDVPVRRLEALRWYEGLRERNPDGAAAILSELEGDADTAWLATHLRSARDPLRKLPDVAGGATFTDAELAALSDEALRWLHLAQWAAQGGYRFADPQLTAYFAQFPWYCPLPKDTWARRRLRIAKNPDALLLAMDRAAIPSGATRENLRAILRAERARGLDPPALTSAPHELSASRNE